MKTSVISSAVLASLLTACGGGSSNSASNTAPREQINTEPKDVVEAVARGAERFDGAAPTVDDLGPYQIAGPIDYRYAPLEVTSRIDDDGRRTETFEVDVAGVIHFPALADGAVAPEAGFPVVLFQHGRHSTCSTTGNENGSESSGTDCQADGLEPIRSDKGYDYIAENMASHGYVVLSVDANDINAQDGGSSNDAGITARASCFCIIWILFVISPATRIPLFGSTNRVVISAPYSE